MAKEIDIQTDIGNISPTDEFQRVKQSPSEAKTGDPIKEVVSDRVSDVVHTVKGIFSEHSEKLFSIVALIGFTLVFYAGHIKSWSDFWRYSVFLIVVLIFYSMMLIGKWIVSKFSKQE